MRSLCFLYGFLTVAVLWLSCAAADSDSYWFFSYSDRTDEDVSVTFKANDRLGNHYKVDAKISIFDYPGANIGTSPMDQVQPKFVSATAWYAPKRDRYNYRLVPDGFYHGPFFIKQNGVDSRVQFQLGFNIDSFRGVGITTANIRPRIMMDLIRHPEDSKVRLFFEQPAQRMEGVCGLTTNTCS